MKKKIYNTGLKNVVAEWNYFSPSEFFIYNQILTTGCSSYLKKKRIRIAINLNMEDIAWLANAVTYIFSSASFNHYTCLWQVSTHSQRWDDPNVT